MNTKFYFIRHGQTNWNTKGMVQGHTNIELNEVGLSQAHFKIMNINDIVFDYIYTSPLLRAKETAHIISKLTKQTAEIIDNDLLIERCFGELEGNKYDINGFNNDDSEFINKFPSYESNEAIKKRISHLIKDISTKHPNKTIAFFTHSHVIKTALCLLNDNKYNYTTKIDNCGIVEFDYINNKLKLVNIDV